MHYRIKYTILIIFIYSFHLCYGQNLKISDYEFQPYNKFSKDSLYKYFITKADNQWQRGSDSAFLNYQIAEVYARISNKDDIKIDFLQKMLSYYILKTNSKKVNIYLNRLDSLLITTTNKAKISQIYYQISVDFTKVDNYEEAYKHTNKSLELAESIGDTITIIKTKLHIIHFLHRSGDLDLAKKKMDELCKKYSSKLNSNKELKISVIGNTVNYYFRIKDFVAAIEQVKSLIGLIKITDPHSIRKKLISAYTQVATINAAKFEYYGLVENYKTAIIYTDSALALSKSLNEEWVIPDIYGLLSTLEYFNKNYLLSIKYAREGITNAEKYHNKRSINTHYESLYLSYQKINKIDSSLKYITKYLNLEKESKANSIDLELAKKDLIREIENNASLVKINSIEKEKIKAERNFSIILSTSIILLLVAGFLIRNLYLKKRENNKFSKYLIKNIEEERQRISNDLHDSIGQGLLFLNLKSENKFFDIISPLLNEVRMIVRNLSPIHIESIAFDVLITRLVEDIKKDCLIYFTYEINPISITDKNIKLNFYRIVQESLSNILKHSGAKNARIIANCNDNFLTIQIMDDGKGFKLKNLKEKNSFGLNSMSQRAESIGADLKIKSTSKGTKIEITYNYEQN